MKKQFAKAVAIVSTTALPAVAMAADAMDMTAITDQVKAAGVAVGTVGAAVLLVMVGMKVWKWVRGAL